MEVKKLSIESKKFYFVNILFFSLDNIRDFFDKFLNADSLIFDEMKHTMFEEQNNLINSLDELKGQVHHYFGEESEVVVKPNDEIRKNMLNKQNRGKLPLMKKIDKINFENKQSEEVIHTKINTDAFSEIPEYVKKDKLNEDLQQVTNSYHKELTKQLFDKINNSFNVK
jgi:hypothetical protein